MLPVLAAAAAAVTVAGVVVIGNHASHPGAGATSLRPLRIGTYTGNVPAAAAAEPSGTRAGRYVLRASLPTEPTRGQVWALGRVSDARAKVVAIGRVFGVSGPVVHDEQGWSITQGRAKVRVYDAAGSPWAYVSDVRLGSCGPLPVDGYAADTSVACAVSSAPGGPSVSEAQARRVAGPLLALLGLSGATYTGDPSMRWVSADPSVGGLATTGFPTEVVVGPGGSVSAGGWLAPVEHALRAVGTYPLRSARQAFDGLALLPVPEIACLAGERCPANVPVVVTGARYALMAAWEDGTDPLLVPAWSFQVAGGGAGPIQGALSPAYVAAPHPPTGGGATSPGSTGGGSAGSGAGSAGPGSSMPVRSGSTPPYRITPSPPVAIPGPPTSPQVVGHPS